ncbi:hypothetical protein PR048_028004 [Dryococelus australis]|uniref:HAT C-terminal dimerisation domain-containing protein n=1 Tax=Dryococelus australis TaxID=614101 RepID=A0ABQ9GI54_9NEOP|nr:hypothetical protein PR048_028004 [Dryococelus australis]
MQDRLLELKKEKQALKTVCETRWVEKQNALLTFLDTLSCLTSTFENFSQVILRKRKQCIFLPSLYTMVRISCRCGLTLPLVRKLQAEDTGILKAIQLVESTMASLKKQHDKSIDSFKLLFIMSEELAMGLGIQMIASIRTDREVIVSKMKFCYVLNRANSERRATNLEANVDIRNLKISPAEGYKMYSALLNISVAFQLLRTLPVKTSTAECSFPTLRRLKTIYAAQRQKMA